MGYTHYWRDSKPLTPAFIDAARKVIAASPVPLAREYDEPGSEPEVSEEGIFFNGVGGDGHETFYFTAGETFAFCKTAAKPYDVVVVALLALVRHFELASVESDGDEDDWKDGVALARSATGLEATGLR